MEWVTGEVRARGGQAVTHSLTVLFSNNTASWGSICNQLQLLLTWNTNNSINDISTSIIYLALSYICMTVHHKTTETFTNITQLHFYFDLFACIICMCVCVTNWVWRNVNFDGYLKHLLCIGEVDNKEHLWRSVPTLHTHSLRQDIPCGWTGRLGMVGNALCFSRITATHSEGKEDKMWYCML